MTTLTSWQRSNLEPFFAALQQGRTHHAWLLIGDAGAGQSAVSEAMAAALLCRARMPDGLACGQCTDCHYRQTGVHADLHRVSLIEGKRQIAVDQIRSGAEKLQGRPQRSGWQLLIVEAADRMNTAAANALLKTLEEPAPDSVLILNTLDSGRLLPTIKSRCRRLLLSPPSPAQALTSLLAAGFNEADAAAALSLHPGNPSHAAAFLGQGRLPELRRQIAVLSDLASGTVSLSAAVTALKPADAGIEALPQICQLWLRGDGGFSQWQAIGQRDLSSALALLQAALQQQRQLGSGLSADAMLLSWLAQLQQLGAARAR